MSIRPSRRTAAAAALLLSGPTFAATQLGDHFTFSGFGTLGGVVTDSNDGKYRREQQGRGADKGGSMLVDSNLGLQLTGKANDWLSGSVQTLTEMRYAEDHMTTRLEWAYIKVTPVDGLSLRVGRFSLPNFLISDSRKIGFANTWLRPADEVYGLDLVNGGLEGADVSYRLPIAGNSLTITGMAGQSAYTDPVDTTDQRKIKQVQGGNLLWDGDWYTVRLGYMEATKIDFNPFLLMLYPPGLFDGVTYKFTGFGFTVDRNDIVVQGEYAKRRLTKLGAIGADGMYLLGGYRMGAFMPYAEYAKRKPAGNSSTEAPQKTLAAGLRWDAFSAASLKFQLEHINTKDTTGVSFITTAPITKPVTTFSVAVDFVF